MEERVEELEGRIDALESLVNDDLDLRATRLRNDLESVKDDIAGLKAKHNLVVYAIEDILRRPPPPPPRPKIKKGARGPRKGA